MGLLFRPSWTSAVIIVSEAETRTRLPLFAMTTYTTAIINRLQPTRYVLSGIYCGILRDRSPSPSVVILDSYPTKVYISPRAISQDNVPIRYLSIREKSILVRSPEIHMRRILL